MCRAGTMASDYEAASADLKAYAGLEVEGRQIQRMVNLKGEQIQNYAHQSPPVVPVKPVEAFYAIVDGTGVPMMAKEVENRPGKQELSIGEQSDHQLLLAFLAVAIVTPIPQDIAGTCYQTANWSCLGKT